MLTLNEKCVVESVTPSGALLTIVVHGSYEGFHTTLQILLEERTTSSPPFTVLYSREI